MNIHQRAKLLEIIDINQSISTTEIAKLCNLSIPTARKYLKLLEIENLITFKRGIALKKIHYVESLLGWQLEAYPKEKELIAKKATQFIENNDTIFLGGGSTVLGIADQLANKKNITIITNSNYVINKVIHHPQINLICVGGRWRASTSSFDGSSMITDVYPDKAFIGAMGLDSKKGVTQLSPIDNQIEFSMFQNSKENFVLADHSKFDVVHPWRAVKSENIQNIITNKKVETLWKKTNIIYV